MTQPDTQPLISSQASPVQEVLNRPSLAKTPLHRFFEAAVKHEAIDLLLRGGTAPKLRLAGKLKSMDVEPIDPDDMEKWVAQSVTDAQWQDYARNGSLDLGMDFPLADGSTHRFRVNIFRTRGYSAIVARRISNTIPTLDELQLPKVLAKIADAPRGLVFIAGTSGSGKSTTIASLIQHINQRRACHILTIEDPIEFSYPPAKAVINQREIGIDVPSFEIGLKALIREAPDVVVIGDVRDKQTIETALQAAEAGHLVFVTIDASNTSQVFTRVYDMFPAQQCAAIRNLMAFQMYAVVCQKLLPKLGQDPTQRLAAVEVLLQCNAAQKFIAEAREHELDQVIKNESGSGMQSFTDCLVELVQNEKLHPKVAIAAATYPLEVQRKLRGIID